MKKLIKKVPVKNIGISIDKAISTAVIRAGIYRKMLMILYYRFRLLLDCIKNELRKQKEEKHKTQIESYWDRCLEIAKENMENFQRETMMKTNPNYGVVIDPARENLFDISSFRIIGMKIPARIVERRIN
jgi:hypothetical protein